MSLGGWNEFGSDTASAFCCITERCCECSHPNVNHSTQRQESVCLSQWAKSTLIKQSPEEPGI